jgi:penicillin-binding protein 1A
VPYEDAEASVREIELRADDPDFAQVLLLSRTNEPLGQKRYWPIYEAAARANLAVGIHAFGNGGYRVQPYGVERIRTAGGQVLFLHRPAQLTQAIANPALGEMHQMMRAVMKFGTGVHAVVPGYDLAGKTGTTSDYKDAWFCGFTGNFTTVVWMGRDDAHPIPGLAGGTAPARAFAQYMKLAVANRPVEQFDTQLKLPDWQLEPDDEANQAGDGNYYYTDDQGNLVSANQPKAGGADAAGGAHGAQEPSAAANDDFLNQATGNDRPPPKLRKIPGF